jgi:serine/threonine protein phosphatase PrpC
MFISKATAQGPRSDQQDRYVVTPVKGGQFLAVMDGHGGRETADFAAVVMPSLVEKKFWEFRGDAKQAYTAIFQELAEKSARETSGSTVSAVFLPEGAQVAQVAILGDSPVMIQNSEKLWMSPLHNARSNLGERRAAIALGAEYQEGYLVDPRMPGQGLQLSRALGDRSLAGILNRNPEVFSIPLGAGSRILLASDGILDSVEIDLEGQLKRLISLIENGKGAQALVDDALARETGDNVTVVIWQA